MGNIMDYIKWRGDLDLSASPFNEVDNLILSLLAYVNLDGILVAAGQKGAGIRNIVDEFLKLHSEEELKKDKSFIRFAPFMMMNMAESERFGNCVIRNYVNEIATEEELQFAAMEILLDDGTSYIAFRGTDDTVIGWKEDFNLSIGVIPAQKRAVEYVRRVSAGSDRFLRIGGHSKGGNLAVYGAVMCEEAYDRILEVYTNDGPGFDLEFQKLAETKGMLSKITRIIPEHSIIGTLLEHRKEPVIVASSNKGLLQHDGFSWEVEGPAFVHRDSLEKSAQVFIDVLYKWIDGKDMEQRKLLIEDLFATIQASGYENISEVQSGGLRSFTAMLKRMEKFAPESRGMVRELIAALFSGWLEQLQADTREKIPFLLQLHLGENP